MFGSGKRQAETAAAMLELRADVLELQKTVRALRLELVETSDKVYRWMKAAQARDRTGARVMPEDPPSLALDTPLQVQATWGPRARRQARLARRREPAAVNGEPED